MSFEANAVVGKIGLDEMPGIKAMNKIVESANEMRSGFLSNTHDMDKAISHLGKGTESALDKLKSTFGRGSAIEETMKTIAGMGVLAGFSEGGRMLGEFAAKAVELRNAFMEGKKSAGDIVEELAAGVPILGSFWTAGRNIRELLTGEKAEVEAINQSAKATVDIFDAWASGLKLGKAALESVDVQVKKLQITMGAAFGNSFQQAQAALKADLAGLPEEMKKGLADAIAPINEQREKLKAALSGLIDVQAQRGTELANYKLSIETGSGNASSDDFKKIQGSFASASADVQSAQSKITQLNEEVRKLSASFDHLGGVKKAALSTQELTPLVDALKKMGAGLASVPHAVMNTSAAGLAQLADIQKQIDQSGMNQYQKMLDDFKRSTGAGDGAGIDKAMKAIDKLEALSVKETILTPGEKFHKAMADIERLHNGGLLTDLMFRRAADRAQTDAFGESKLPSLVRAGSAEAQAARYDGGRGTQNQADPIALQKRQVEGIDKTNTLLSKLVNAWGTIQVQDPTTA